MGMLKDAKVATRLPAKDLNRARAFYSEKLGLEPVEQREGGLRYVCGAGEFAIFVSAGVQSGTHTQMTWEVDNIEATDTAFEIRGKLLGQLAVSTVSLPAAFAPEGFGVGGAVVVQVIKPICLGCRVLALSEGLGLLCHRKFVSPSSVS